MTTDPTADRAPLAHGRTIRVLLALMATLSLIVAAVGGISYASYRAAEEIGVRKDIFQDPTASPGANVPTGPCVEDVCNYLILGSDSREGLSRDEQIRFGTDDDIGGENRADTILLVHSDPRRDKAVILSFPRDLWVDIPGHGEGKINTAFQGGVDGGGPDLVAKAVHELTGLRINHFVYVDLAGFQDIVNTLDGVEMCIPAENVNTPGPVESGPSTFEYYDEPGYIADPYTGLYVKPGCQVLPGDQALAYVRTRHLRCDAVPDFARINRQQEFLRAVINRLLQPGELLKAPSLVRPVLASLQRDHELTPADLVYLVGQMQGMTTGAAEFRSVPGTVGEEPPPPGSTVPLSVVHMDPSAEELFAALREGRPLPKVGTSLEGVEPSAATIDVPVVDHGSGGIATEVNAILADAGFIVSDVVTYATFGADVKGSAIAFEPGHEIEAQVVAKYFPGLELVQTEAGALTGSDVAVFVTSGYELQEPGTGAAPDECLSVSD
jgi:LCP family protein required for cell wall assembly